MTNESLIDWRCESHMIDSVHADMPEKWYLRAKRVPEQKRTIKGWIYYGV